MAPEFVGFPKLHRLHRTYSITEKIDGTNAAVGIGDDGTVWAQSRKRIIRVGDDNFGFAAWVDRHQERLRSLLGPGLHFGEWWGKGIQRGYGLDERRFSLFNAPRWTDVVGWDAASGQDIGLHVVPLLHIDEKFSSLVVNGFVNGLRLDGSCAAPGWPTPEGVVVWHHAAHVGFKVTCENDEVPKAMVMRGNVLDARAA